MKKKIALPLGKSSLVSTVMTISVHDPASMLHRRKVHATCYREICRLQ